MVFAVPFDVTNEASVRGALEQISLNGSIPSIIVNNAPINPKATDLMEGQQVQHPSRLEFIALDSWTKEINWVLLVPFLLVEYSVKEWLIQEPRYYCQYCI